MCHPSASLLYISLPVIFPPEPISCFFSSCFLFLSSFLHLHSGPWACDTKINGNEHKLPFCCWLKPFLQLRTLMMDILYSSWKHLIRFFFRCVFFPYLNSSKRIIVHWHVLAYKGPWAFFKHFGSIESEYTNLLAVYYFTLLCAEEKKTHLNHRTRDHPGQDHDSSCFHSVGFTESHPMF